MYKIYAHINRINKKVYIGQTCRKPEIRWNNGKGYINNPKFYPAILKYGWDGFEHIILEEGLTKEEASIAEQKWITHFDSYNNGYNATTGGEINYVHNGKKILQINPDTGEIIKIYKTKEQLESIGINHTTLKKACKSIYTYLNCYWIELNDYKGSFFLSKLYEDIYPDNLFINQNNNNLKDKNVGLINKKELFYYGGPAAYNKNKKKPFIAINKFFAEKSLYCSSIGIGSQILNKDTRTIIYHLDNDIPLKISGDLYQLEYY